jgi:hypothetical protein
MRFLIRATLPVEATNACFKDGSFVHTLQSILQDIKPEAVYFTTQEGCRTGYVVVDIQDASQMTAIAEPFFLAFNAKVDWLPVMLPEDLMKGGAAIEKAVKKYA